MNVRQPLSYFLGGALLALLLGWWEGHPFVVLSVYALAVAAWSLWQQARFGQWLARDQRLSGLGWDNLADRVDRLRLRERQRTRRVVTALRLARDAARASPDGLVVLDTGMRINWLNPAAELLLGLDRRRDTGERFTNLVRHPRMAQCLQLAQPGDSLVLDSRGGSERSLGLQAAPLENGGRLIVVRDVTAEQKSSDARRDFVANASHELRSPLTVIRGYLEAMAGDPGIDETWHRPLQEMSRQAQRMSDLLRDLMDLSRLDRLYRPAELEEIAMAAMLHRVGPDVVAAIGAQRKLHIEADPDLRLLGDQPEIVLIVSNLVANAARYTGSDGVISVRWQPVPEGAILSVSDNGIGIAREEIPRLTERFYRVDKGRSREAGGTGLGLAIVGNALERHGARLEIDSEIGKGSVFRCIFPRDRVVISNSELDKKVSNHG